MVIEIGDGPLRVATTYEERLRSRSLGASYVERGRLVAGDDVAHREVAVHEVRGVLNARVVLRRVAEHEHLGLAEVGRVGIVRRFLMRVVEEVEDALLEEDALDEGEIALVVLDAVRMDGQLFKDAQAIRHAVLAQDVLGHGD